VCRVGDHALVRVAGRATLHDSTPVRRWCEEQLATGAQDLTVILAECTYLDSTFLGTLLCLRRRFGAVGRFAVAAASPECRRLFVQMGLASLFPTIQEAPPEGGRWECLPPGSGDEAVRRTVVDAHYELAGLPGPAGEAFRDVASCLATEPGA
jgi:anti-anti-sigma factor